MNFSAYSIKNPVPAIMLFALLTIAGLLAFSSTPVQDNPDIEVPFVTVSAALPGAAPAQLETDVARKIENAVASLQGVKNISSSILDGLVTVTVEFNVDKVLDVAVIDVRDAVARIRADLPSELLDPNVSKRSTAGQAVVTFTAAAAPGSLLDAQELSWFVDNTVMRELLGVSGVGAVNRIGGVTREVRIELDPGRMAALGVAADEISSQLRMAQREAPGGRGSIGGAEQAVRAIATARSTPELARMEIPLRDGRQIRLDQIATITDTVAEQRALAHHDGKPVVGFEVYRVRGASEVDVAQGVRAAIAKLQASHSNIEIATAIDNVAAVEENFDGSMALLYEGAVLAVLVVWWFLRDWRATLVAASALPLSVIPAFLGMAYFGFTLNTVTLLALALVIGVLVDDAIVEIENIARHLQMGKSPMEAAMEAANEIGMAVIATTFALVAVFLPTAFMGGVAGRFFKQFGWTAVLAIIASLVVARLLTPMMAAYLLKPSKHVEPVDGKIMRSYMTLMRWCLQHRKATTLASALFFIGALSLVPLLPTGFVPTADRAQTRINVELPPGSTLSDTEAIADAARVAAMQVKGVTSVFSSIGGGASGDPFSGGGTAAEARRATLFVTVVHRNARQETLGQIEADIRQRLSAIPGARINVGQAATGGKMQLVLLSDDPAILASTAQRVERELRTLPGTGGVSSSASLVRPEISVRPDLARAADMGVTVTAIANTVRVATLGDYDINLPKLNLAERQVPIRVQLPDAIRADLAALGRLTVPGKNGPVLLSHVASLTMESGPAQIARLNRRRSVMLEVELGSRSLGELDTQAKALPSLRSLPPTVSLGEIGDTREMTALFKSFGVAMAIGILCIYGVLVLLFKDFMQPVTILAALPLSIGGAFVGLLVTSSALSLPSLIGLVMLMGIVTKNSILLVDYAILARQQGMDRFDALVDACHKRSRPIVMTTIAMVAGMMPLAMGWGADPSFRSPMAITVIGGLITSTLLSLLVIPVVFSYIDDLEQLLKMLTTRIRPQHPLPPPQPAN